MILTLKISKKGIEIPFFDVIMDLTKENLSREKIKFYRTGATIMADMADFYSDKLFEFTNQFTDSSEWIGNIKIVQIGETCLDKGASIKEHIQSCHEVTFITSGTGVLVCDRLECRCSVGDLQIVSKGTRHNIIADPGSELRYIHFAFDFEDFKPQTLAEFYGQCKHMLLHDNGNIRQVLNMLVDEYISDLHFRDIMKSSLAHAALILIWRKANLPSVESRPIIKADPMGNTVYNIIKYIDHHMDTKLTVSSIAKKFSYTGEYLSRLFKEKTGTPLKKYMLTMKMRYAQTLLSEGKCTLSEIAELMGYATTQAFCKAFKNETGYTPKQFDKSAQ